jgi:hypothetical protein
MGGAYKKPYTGYKTPHVDSYSYTNDKGSNGYAHPQSYFYTYSWSNRRWRHLESHMDTHRYY